MTGMCTPVSISYPITDGVQGFICSRQVIYQANYSPSLISSPLFLKNHLYLIFILCVSVHGHVYSICVNVSRTCGSLSSTPYELWEGVCVGGHTWVLGPRSRLLYLQSRLTVPHFMHINFTFKTKLKCSNSVPEHKHIWKVALTWGLEAYDQQEQGAQSW